MCKEALERDLGLLDQFEARIVQNMFNEEGFCRSDRMTYYVFKLIRRDVTAAATINALRRMSNVQLLRLTETAQRLCSDHELETFSTKVRRYRQEGLSVEKHTMAPPLGNRREVRNAAISTLKQVM